MKSLLKQFFLLILFFASIGVHGQVAFEFDQSISIETNERRLPLGLAGGLNAAQVQTMDLNGNGGEELVIWDINSRQIMVFTQGSDGFIHLPEMSYYFPSDVSGFLILADYDGDGKKDLFTSSPFGIRAYKNVSSSGASFPSWELAQNFLRLDNNSNLQANNLDIPLIMDVDGDGDLDIATFNFASGDFLEFYKNTSMERKGTPDIDGFAFPEVRWGGFEFCDCGQFSFGVTCAGLPMGRIAPEENNRIEHAGGHAVLYADFNGDGVMDLVMGQDECSTLYYLPNKGTNAEPVFDEFSTSLPDVGELPSFPIFHTAQIWKNQLLISTNSSSIAGPFRSDYSNNFFSIPLEGGVTSPFLQQDMLDLGENTRPFFRGNRLSGTLLLSANTLIGRTVVGQLIRFQVSDDVWRMEEMDYLNMSSLDLTDLQVLSHRASSGQDTHWLAGTDTVSFSLVKKLFFTTSTNFTDLSEINIPGATPRPLDHFEFFTYQNQDYMLMARQTGELLLYQATFESNQPYFTLLETSFLGFQDNPSARNLSVHVVAGQRPSLYASDQRGQIFWIADFMNNENREEVLVKIGEESRPFRLGRNSWLSTVSDPFGGSNSLIIGNTAGGIQYLKSADSAETPSNGTFVARVFPNPTNGPIKLLVNKLAEASLINSFGQILIDHIEVPANREVELQATHLSPGLYIIKLRSEDGMEISKKVIVRP
ncbi:T9SS type A sorting domain-containing protein [Belliella sp. DSM 111904]|uniref:T9SS type A sorting domain-containing protein n=1 Tax=Belliella filtrata TaxID=2923435 RepID=A0ABS9V0M3_9BACT|nr:T9SS type A sorting domain-containing protein [Belliella filtrata]MCH7409941.1 T9SS type A sorting domain-containing protein [Belliella filtrata]